MNAFFEGIHSLLLVLMLCSCVLAIQDLTIEERCLPLHEKLNWTRSLHFNNQSFSLNIEVNDRPSHWIVNYIFEILLRERLGYRNINFIYSPWSSASETLARLNCEVSKNCSRPPSIHVNIDVWLPTGERIDRNVPSNRVRINGALGPITRWGLYTSRKNLDHWTAISKTPRHNKSVARGVLYYDRPSILRAYQNLLSDDDAHMDLSPIWRPTQSLWNFTNQIPQENLLPVLLNWYPNTLTLNSRLMRIGLPDCAALRARSSLSGEVDASCTFELNQPLKVSWAGLAEAAPLIAQLIDHLRIKQRDYIELLRAVGPDLLNYTDALQLGTERSFRAGYRTIACRWLRSHQSTWQEWTKGWNIKKEIIIGGMFTSTGSDEYTDLAPDAFRAVDVLNGEEKYFGNSEYAIRLQIRNLTCSQNVVLNDFFNFLTINPSNESILGVILALCSDAIESTVRLANLRRVLVISPTVESASFLWRKHYKFFFRTIPSAYTASFMFIRLFQEWRWKRVAIFRKDDHYFYRDAFTANNITLVDDFEVKESVLTYAIAQKNVMSVKQRNGRIIIVDHSAAATALILCAAFHLNMRAEKGYTWFLSPWISQKFWDSPEVVPRECTAEDLKVMHNYTFSVSQPLQKGEVTYSNLRSTIGGPSPSFKSSNGKSQVRIHSQQRQLFELCTFESVIVLGSAMARLLHENPSAISILNNVRTSERLRSFVSQTHMEYSERDYIDKKAVSFFSYNADYLGETLVHALDVTPPSPPTPTLTRLPPPHEENSNASKFQHLSFDSHNNRLLDTWLVKQIKKDTLLPIALWSFTGHLGGRDEEAENDSEVSDSIDHRYPVSRVGIDWEQYRLMKDSEDEDGEEENSGEVNRKGAIAYKTFAASLSKRTLDTPEWGAGRFVPPNDGSIAETDCAFAFLSRWFGVSCVVSNWIFAMALLLVIVVPVVAIVLTYFRRRLREAEKLTRKPYEELCALLSDVNIPLSDIVLNRRIGDGAFGLVFGGEAKFGGRWEAVAVKRNTNRTTYEAKVEFLSEAKLMRDLQHRNIVRLVGVCVHRPQDEIYLIMELMLMGDLKKYLLERRLIAQRFPNHEDISPATLTRMALDIAEGLAYLHDKQLIHRDIACRNCLVGPDRVVKIGDFGLTREATVGSPHGYYRFTRNVELPIRWMPPEAVQFGIFSVKSDLWSYGIVLYEIITFGMFPYVELGDVEVVERVKRSEFSITQILPPAAVGTTVWRLIVCCCQYYWQHRPESMHSVIEEIRSNENCIRPYLTDEPPTVEFTPVSFLPGPGACIVPEMLPATQPAFSAPMGGRTCMGGGAPFMNPSSAYTEPPLASSQRYTSAAANSLGASANQKTFYFPPTANFSSSVTSATNSGHTSDRPALPLSSTATPVYAPPGHPGCQSSEEFHCLLNPTNRSMSLEFLQKSDFQMHTPLPDRVEGDPIDRGGDTDTEDGHGSLHQCASCPQKPSLLSRNVPRPSPPVNRRLKLHETFAQFLLGPKLPKI